MAFAQYIEYIYLLVVNKLFLFWQFIKLYFIGLVSLVKQILKRKFRPGKYPDQTGRVAIVTGGAAGIGRHITSTLVRHNCHVFIGSRCSEEADLTIRGIKKDFPSAQVKFIPLDLSSLRSVKSFVEAFLLEGCPLHLLINNAGVMLTPYSETEDGYERQYQVNFLGHFYLTQLLLDKLKASGAAEAPSRIVNVASSVHWVADPEPVIFPSTVHDTRQAELQYSPHNAYASSKLAIILGTFKLASELRGDNSFVTVNCVHPGVVDSDLYQHVHWSIRGPLHILAKTFLYKTLQQGADTVVDVALSPNWTWVRGRYFDNGALADSSSKSQDPALQKRLWHHAELCIQRHVSLQ